MTNVVTPQERYQSRIKAIDANTGNAPIAGRIVITPGQAIIFKKIAKLELNLSNAQGLAKKGDLSNAAVNYNSAVKMFDELNLMTMSSPVQVRGSHEVLQMCYTYLMFVGAELDKHIKGGSIMDNIENDIKDGWSGFFR
jgi:hypothetical protein